MPIDYYNSRRPSFLTNSEGHRHTRSVRDEVERPEEDESKLAQSRPDGDKDARYTKRRRDLMEAHEDEDEDELPKRPKKSLPAEHSPVIDLSNDEEQDESPQGNMGGVHTEGRPRNEEHDGDENKNASFHPEEEDKSSVRSESSHQSSSSDSQSSTPSHLSVPKQITCLPSHHHPNDRTGTVPHDQSKIADSELNHASNRLLNRASRLGSVPSHSSNRLGTEPNRQPAPNQVNASDTRSTAPADIHNEQPTAPIRLKHYTLLHPLGEHCYWNSMLKRFYQMVETHGVLDINMIQEKIRNSVLGRCNKKEAFENQWIATDKLNLLLKARFQFTEEEETPEAWEKNMARLVQFYQTHGHTRVPEDGDFGTWVERQRMKGHHGRLHPKRYMRLKALDFEFDPNYLLHPLRAAETALPLPEMDIFQIKDAAEEVLAIPEQGFTSRLRRIGWSLLVCAVVIGGLMMYVSIVVAIGVGLHMGYLWLRGDDIVMPKIYEELCIANH